MQTKTCTKCGEEKPLDRFSKHKSGKYGVQSHCKECASEYHRRYHEENLEKERERSRRRYEENREEVLEQKRRYREENREAMRERERIYREENREAIRERDRIYHEENREERLELARRYYEKNREVINAKISLRMATTREVSKSLSTVQPGTPWSEQEDAFLMADNGMTTYQKATHLGRNYNACTSRRHILRKKLGVSPGDH